MAKKKKKDLDKKDGLWHNMEDAAVRAIMAVICFAVALLALLAAFGKAGFGNNVFAILTDLLGVGYYLIPIIFALLGISFLKDVERRIESPKIIGAIIFFISSLGLIYLLSPVSSGIVGKWIAYPLLRLLDTWATVTLLVTFFIVSLIMMFEWKLTLSWMFSWMKHKDKVALSGKETEMDAHEQAAVAEAMASARGDDAEENGTPTETKKPVEIKKPLKRGALLDFSDAEQAGFASSVVLSHMKPFNPPPLSLLEKDRGKPETGDIKANANIIKRSLQNFGITVEMDEISIGPSVTRYALKPAEGVKLSRIVGLSSDLSLALAAHPIRIEAPIPGKSLVGIEVPNTAKTTVGLATLLASPDFHESEKPLLMSLGKDITGRAHFTNLAKAPHMLIAGATGSGKSVTIHALITSLLYRNSPENMKFIMIDPKRVELTLYNKIPHLLTPVITDPKKAILALKWAAKEMSRRYNTLEQNTVRDIESYHKSILAPALAKLKGKEEADESATIPETMPYIVVVIDELADIMQTYPRELESAIVRLAQMSRAVGIHLIISTQRPSVNVITGLIKANIPTRVALQVSSQIDSRTILDQAGAEKLLGAGDMLYLGGEMSKPVRLQSAYISETEVKKVVSYLANEYKDEIVNEISLTGPEAGASSAFDAMLNGDSLEDEDEMYEPAREAVIAAGKASTSYIQRKLGVGYSRAAKLMDLLEQHGVIGPANGSKPREIIDGGSDSGDIGIPETNDSEPDIL